MQVTFMEKKMQNKKNTKEKKGKINNFKLNIGQSTTTILGNTFKIYR